MANKFVADVLVTGGAGFIGSRLCSHLLASGLSVRILDVLSEQVHGAVPEGIDWLNDKRIEFIRGSVNNHSICTKALQDVRYVVHLAAETGTGQSMYDISHYNYVNSQGTAVLLDAIASQCHRSIERIVLTSSRSVYGEGAYICPSCGESSGRLFPSVRLADKLASRSWDPLCPSCTNPLVAVPTREDDPVRPASIYAATKYAQEELVRVACDTFGIGYAILRLQNVYGEGQSLKNPYTGILSIFSTRARLGLDLPIFEDGLESRDFIYVDDVARAISSCLLSDCPINSVVNVGSGVGSSVIDVARQLVTSLDANVPVRVTGEYRLGDIRHNVADIGRLLKLLPGVPLTTIAIGLDLFAAWVKTQPLPEDRLDRANAELRERKLMA